MLASRCMRFQGPVATASFVALDDTETNKQPQKQTVRQTEERTNTDTGNTDWRQLHRIHSDQPPRANRSIEITAMQSAIFVME